MRPSPLPFLVPVAAALSLAATATAANASTLCVGPQAPGISCDAQYPFTGTGLGDAVATANGNAPATDTVRVSAGTLTGLPSLSLSGATDTMIGAGRDQTILAFAALSGQLLTIGSNGSTSVRDLTVQSTSFTGNGIVLSLGNGALAERVRVVERSPANPLGVRTVNISTGATLRSAEVEINSNQDIGVSNANGGATIEDSTISGGGAGYAAVQASSSSGTVELRRLHISGVSVGVTSDAGAFDLDDSVIDLGSLTNAVGVSGRNFNLGSTTISAQIRRSTIVGSGASQTGVWDDADSPGEHTSTIVRDSLLRVTGAGSKDIHCGDVGWAGTSTLATLNTGYGALAVHAPTCSHTSTADANLAATPPTFVNGAAGDYRPTWNSPVVDRGTGNAPGATTDVAGGLRLVDGDGVGGAYVDLGAYEYQRVAPLAPAATIPTTGSIGDALTFIASGTTDPDADPIVEYAWDFGDGATATGATASHAYAASGAYTVTVRAKDVTGLIGAPASALMTVPAAATPAASSAPVATPAPAAAPILKLVTAPKKSVKRGKVGFSIAPKPSATAAVVSTINAAGLRLTVVRLVAGRVTGKGCSHAATKGKRCTAPSAVKGSATVAVATGTTNLAFGGTFGGKRLPAGRYAVTVTPVSATGAAGTPITYRVTLR